MKATDTISSCIFEIFDNLRANPSVRNISPMMVADAAYNKLDPEKSSPFLVRFCALSDLAQRARSLLRGRVESELESAAEAHDDTQITMFEKLQPWYPVYDTQDGGYVRREDLTYQQRVTITEKLRKTGRGFLAHADAFEAETNLLVAEGKLIISVSTTPPSGTDAIA